MRVMVIVKATADSENGVMPTTEELTAMGQYNEELVKAGIMAAAKGFTPAAGGSACAFPVTRAPSSTARSPRRRS